MVDHRPRIHSRMATECSTLTGTHLLFELAARVVDIRIKQRARSSILTGGGQKSWRRDKRAQPCATTGLGLTKKLLGDEESSKWPKYAQYGESGRL